MSFFLLEKTYIPVFLLFFAGKWDPARSLNDASVSAWFCSTAHHRAVDQLKHLKVLARTRNFLLALPPSPSSPCPVDQLIRIEEASHARATVVRARTIIAHTLLHLNGTPRNHRDRQIAGYLWIGEDIYQDAAIQLLLAQRPTVFDAFLCEPEAMTGEEVTRVVSCSNATVTRAKVKVKKIIQGALQHLT